jgi:hypothetical protein
MHVGVLAVNVVSSVTRHSEKYNSNGYAHRIYEAPPETSFVTMRAHTTARLM